jgi:23S rRNA pseudouridine2605 synthase
LLTNDGELAHRLMHPSFGVSKTYLATVPAPIGKDVARRVRAGVQLDDGPVAVDSWRVVQRTGDRAIVEVVLHEGRKHIVRRLLDAVGHPVQRLVRTAIGPVRLGNLKAGAVRELSREELSDLHRQVDEHR